jgi:hypothetical protein
LIICKVFLGARDNNQRREREREDVKSGHSVTNRYEFYLNTHERI